MISLSTRTQRSHQNRPRHGHRLRDRHVHGLDKPYWAGIADGDDQYIVCRRVADRGIARSLGTLVGGRWRAWRSWACFHRSAGCLMVCVSLYVGFCTYMLTGKWSIVLLVPGRNDLPGHSLPSVHHRSRRVPSIPPCCAPRKQRWAPWFIPWSRCSSGHAAAWACSTKPAASYGRRKLSCTGLIRR